MCLFACLFIQCLFLLLDCKLGEGRNSVCLSYLPLFPRAWHIVGALEITGWMNERHPVHEIPSDSSIHAFGGGEGFIQVLWRALQLEYHYSRERGRRTLQVNMCIVCHTLWVQISALPFVTVRPLVSDLTSLSLWFLLCQTEMTSVSAYEG